MQARLTVGFLHADVEGGNRFAAHVILAGYIDASQELLVVDGKAGNLVHICCLLLFSKGWIIMSLGIVG